MKHKELLLEQADKLRQIKLPENWSVSRLEVTFKRAGVLEEYAEVIYDSMNDTFYVKNNKCYIYPNDLKALNEGFEIMKQANNIIKHEKLVE